MGSSGGKGCGLGQRGDGVSGRGNDQQGSVQRVDG